MKRVIVLLSALAMFMTMMLPASAVKYGTEDTGDVYSSPKPETLREATDTGEMDNHFGVGIDCSPSLGHAWHRGHPVGSPVLCTYDIVR